MKVGVHIRKETHTRLSEHLVGQSMELSELVEQLSLEYLQRIGE